MDYDQICSLFYSYLDPRNPNPEESGNMLLEQFCSSINILLMIIQNNHNLRRQGIVLLKRVLDLILNDMNEEGKRNIFGFVTMVLIPTILPSDSNYLSPIVYEIFSSVSQAANVNISSLNEYIKKLQGEPFLPFIITYLIHIDSNYLDLEFSFNILSMVLELNNPGLFEICVQLFVNVSNNFPETPFYSSFVQKIAAISVELSSPKIWNNLCNLSSDLTQAFMEPAYSVFSNDSFFFEVRVSAFFFFECNINESNLKDLGNLISFLVEFQTINLDENKNVDHSLYFLIQNFLQIPQIRTEAFEIIKESTFQQINFDNPVNQVIGLYSLEYLIDNSHDMTLTEYIPSDLSIFHPFFTSGDSLIIDASFEVLKVLIGKPLGLHFDFEPIFQDVIELFLNADDYVRNRTANFLYKYVKSNFVVKYWVFGKFIQLLNLVKASELSIYLEILAESILNLISNFIIPDSELNSLIEMSSEILNSERDLDEKIPAASLCCSLIQKDADLSYQIGGLATYSALMAITQPDPWMRKTMSTCLIRFIKCTNGAFLSHFRVNYQKLLNCAFINNNELSANGEPILLSEIIKWDPEFPDKENFLNFLMKIISDPFNREQYEIASICLKKVIIGFSLETQIQLTTHICSTIFNPNFFPLIRFNILMLSPMLKEKNPNENRVHIAQMVSEIIQPFPDNILKNYIGSLSRLMVVLIRSIGPEVPNNLKQFCFQLFEKTMESPLYYTAFAYFLFSDCIKYSVINMDATNLIIDRAFANVSCNLSNWDTCTFLMCIKAGIEKSTSILNQERMAILFNCWRRVSSDLSMVLSKTYLANIFIILGCNNMIPDELFIASIQAFPMEVKNITGEICNIFLANFQNINGKNPAVVKEVFFALIRLLSAGKSIRFTHKLHQDMVVLMIRLALSLAVAIHLDIGVAVQMCLADSPRKQAAVNEFFHQVISSS